MVFENGYVLIDGQRVKAISGGQGGAGAGAGGGAGGAGGAAGAMGGMSNIDFTFGQGKVWEDKTKREMALLMGLIDASGKAGSRTVNRGQTPGAAQPVRSWDPSLILKLLSFRG